MQRKLLIIIGVIFSIGLNAQVTLGLHAMPSDDSMTKCYSFSIKSSESLANHKIGSQNIRLFYDSSKGTLSTEASKLLLDEDEYYFGINQHVTDLNAKGVGAIPFESTLGFINAAIVLNDMSRGGQAFNKDLKIAVAQFCFDLNAENTAGDIPLMFADIELTADYGRAFNELSALNSTDALVSVKIESFSIEQD